MQNAFGWVEVRQQRKALRHLGRYLYRGVLTGTDIIFDDDRNVSFYYPANKQKRQVRILPGGDLL